MKQKKNYAYRQENKTSQIILRLAVWYFLAVQFVPRGVDLHHQLKRKSCDFNEFKEDESGQYVTLKHDTLQETSERPYVR